MKIIQWSKLIEDSNIQLFTCETCQNKVFNPIQTISLRNSSQTNQLITPIQYVECVKCKTVYALIQEDSNEFKVSSI